jgi:hypothetical protein
MKLSSNRALAGVYLILAATPIGILVVMLYYSSVGELWATRSIARLPINMFALGLATVAFAGACLPNRPRTRGFWLFMLCASLALGLMASFALSWVTGLVYLLPVWLVWRQFRESLNHTPAA